jgi:putative transposase
MGGTIRGLGAVPESIGGVEDHVHVLLGLRATLGLSDLMRELKKATSVWAVKKHDHTFGWQDGYAAFSVSYTHLPSVKTYIENQVEHHRHCTFGDELKRLMEINGVQFDSRDLE